MKILLAGITRCAQALLWLLNALLRVCGALLGHWQLPPWLRWLLARLQAAGRWCLKHPARSLPLTALLLGLSGGGIWGYRWYQAQPKPVYPACELTGPALTRWENERPVIDPLLLTCNESVAPLDKLGKVVTQGLRLTPAIPGQWIWASDRQLTFTPAQDWPVGQEIRLELQKKTLLPPQVHLARYDYSTQTAAFAARLETVQFYQDPQNPALKKLVATAAFSHPVDEASLRERVSLSLPQGASLLGINADATQFTLSLDNTRLRTFIHSNSLTLPRENLSMTLQLAAGIQAARGGPAAPALQQSITIPGRFSLDFSSFSMVLADNDKHEPEQILLLSSNAPVPDNLMEKRTRAWLLPERDAKQQPVHWHSGMITPQVLASAQPLSLQQLPSDDPEQRLHSFRFAAPVGRSVYVEVGAGITAIGGTQNAKAAQAVVKVVPFERSLKFMGEGQVLGLNGEKKLGWVARALDGVKIEVGRLLPQQLHQLLAINGGGFDIPEDDWAEDRLVERFTERRWVLESAPGKPVYDHLDLSPYFAGEAASSPRLGVFLVRASGIKRQGANDMDDQSYSDTRDSRLLVVTDLGLLNKENLDGSYDIFVQSLSRGEPLAGVSVQLVGRNGLALERQVTDAQGRVHLAKPSQDAQREKYPLMVLAQLGEDTAFLPLNRSDRALNWSRFDVGGVDSAIDPNTLSCYLFSDRGLYRPGEQLQLGTLLRTQDWQKPLQGVPLQLEITDPRGQVVAKQDFQAGAAGFNTLQWQSQATSPTGQYSASVYLLRSDKTRANFLGSTGFKLQEFEPDRMKVSAQLGATGQGWLSPEAVQAQVFAQNLFGTAASQRRVTAEMTLTPQVPSFSQYPDYRFFVPPLTAAAQVLPLPDSKTDDTGQASLTLDLARFANSTYRLSLLARVFEAEGGRNVAAFSDTLVSSMPYLVGVKKTDADVNYLSKDSRQSSRWQALDPALKGLALEGLTLEWVQRKAVSVLLKQDNGTYRYQSRIKEVLRDSRSQNLAAKGSEISLPTEEPGDFALVLKNPDGQVLNRLDYAVVGQGNLSRALERGAELQLKLNKTDYLPGESLEVSVQTPYLGAGLITLERDRVYSHHWFKTDTTSSLQRITIPADFEGNGYVTVQFIRAPDSSEVFTSPLAYGTVPFKMSLAPRTQNLQLSAPALAKPGEPLTLSLRGTRPGKALVYAVDEGILQVARYKTPDPLGFFFQKRRLQVRSLQSLDLVLPEFSQLLKASAPGGDADGLLAKHLNPFKNKRKAPAVYWSGLLDVGPDGLTLSYTPPSYFNGKLRLFALSADDASLGVTESATEVRADLIISPNLPSILAPGDEADISVSLANNLKSSQGPVRLQLHTNEQLSLLGPSEQSLEVAPGKEAVASFRIKAEQHLGAAQLRFSAQLGTHRAQVEEGLSVRPASGYRTQLNLGRTQASAQSLPLERQLFAEHRQVNLSLAQGPVAWAEGLQSYLQNYPYSCTEQLVSMAWPGLLLSQHSSLGSLKGTSTLDNLVSTLASRQNEEGGFGLYTNSATATWPSLWAIHWLLEAKARQLNLPVSLLNNSSPWLQNLARPWGETLQDLRQRSYAIYLLSRQGQQTGSQIASLQQELEQRFAQQWRQDIAAAYLGASLALVQKQAQGQKLIEAVPWDTSSYELYNDPLSHQGQLLYLRAKHFPEGLAHIPDTLLDSLGQRLMQREYHSLNAAYLLLGLTQYTETAQQQQRQPLDVSVLMGKNPSQRLATSGALVERLSLPLGATGVQIQQSNPLPLYYSLAEIGFDRTPAPAQNQGIEVQRDYLNLAGERIEQVTLGEEFLVRLRIRASDRDAVTDVVLVDLLPGAVDPVISPPPGPAAAPPEDDTGLNDAEAEAYAEGDADAEETPSQPPRVPGFAGEPGQTSWQADYADLRDDRLVIYGSISRDMATFTYRVKASNSGLFTAPPPYAEAMYDNRLFSQGASHPLRVVKPL